VNPQFFVENQRERTNPHDERDPAESARIIKQHVLDGLELAQKHHLPRAVQDVILQHHGTTLVRYFYHRAIEQSQPPFAKRTDVPLVAISEKAFRYDGPKPQFKESAVISLADAVEATARSIRELSTDKIHEVIEKIVAERINDAQLAEAPLTLEEITRIKTSFQFTLVNMLHARLAYPPGESYLPSEKAPPRESGAPA
jgi:membrane-associated HD superfamily phosphohydrolase